MVEALTLPTISIVTPSFNRKIYLPETMESVLGQGYPKLDYVVVDGGSTDGSVELIREREAELAWWVSEPDNGPWEAINKGFAHTTGEVMGWLGSDDLLMPWTLSVVGELFALFPEIEWLTTTFPVIWDEAGRAVDCWYNDSYGRDGFFRGDNLPGAGWRAVGFIQQESTFWRRSLWNRAGGRLDESLALAADFDLWARFHQSGAELCGVTTPLGGFRIHGNQISLQAFERYVEEALEVFARYGGKPPGRVAGRLRLPLARALPLRFRKTARAFHLRTPQKVYVHEPTVGWRIETR